MGLFLNADALLHPDFPARILARRAAVLSNLEAAMQALDPEHLVRSRLSTRKDLDGCTVFAFGKAAVPMARGLRGLCKPRGGFVVGARPPGALEPDLGPLQFREGGHPVPRRDAAEVGQEVLDLAQGLGPEDLALCLVSGGGSSMLELPEEGVTLEAIRSQTARALEAGLSIVELNTLRRSWSRLKGGGLAQALSPARVLNVILSDVPGADPSWVASGPTVAAGTEDLVAGSNGTARELTGMAPAGADGLPGSSLIEGEAREAGALFYRGCSDRAQVAGGETTVRVRGPGRGGRNQEFVLGALASGYRGGLLLSFGTDGVDGNSRLAGAFIDEEVVARAQAAGLDPRDALERNDSEAFFDACGGGLETGPTGTNVADLVIYVP